MRKKLALHTAIWLSLTAFPLAAFAYHPLITDDTGTQGEGGNQLELDYDWSRSKEAGISETSRAVPFGYTRGITDNLDLFIGASRQTDPVSGWNNVSIGAKWRFYEDEASKLSFAVKPEILLPISRSNEEKGLGNAETSYALTFIATQETTFGELHFNLAAERSNTELPSSDRKNLYRASVAPVWAVTEQWKLALDMGVQTNPDHTQSANMGYVELGAIYSPNENLDLSLGVVRDVHDGPVSTTSATMGVTWRFK